MSKNANLSRRAMLAGAAAAMPATAIATPSIGQDADLLVLGVQLDQLTQEWLAMTAWCDKQTTAFNVLVEEATGIASRDAPDVDEDPTGYWDTRSALSKTHHDDEGLDRTINSIHGRLYPLAEHILSIKAATAAGLAVQARAVTLAAAELWDEGREDTHERLFIEAVCAFVGITVLPRASVLGETSVKITTNSDPVFAAIDRCKRAETDFEIMLGEKEKKDKGAFALAGAAREKALAANEAEFDEQEDRGGAATIEAAHELAATVPTTRDGLLASVGFVKSSLDENSNLFDDTDTLGTFLGSIASAINLGRG